MATVFDLFKRGEAPARPAGPITHLVVGLGNPGKEYLFTRHNAGFMAIDFFAEKLGAEIKKARFQALTADVTVGEKRVLLMKPQLYMNRSGESVRDAADFYKIPPERILVLCDDVNLDVGKLRIRRKGSDGGQKGLRDIIYQLSSDAFPRIRLGVGKLPEGGNLVNWVLGKIPEGDRENFFAVIGKASEAIPMVLSDKIDAAMCEFNG